MQCRDRSLSLGAHAAKGVQPERVIKLEAAPWRAVTWTDHHSIEGRIDPLYSGLGAWLILIRRDGRGRQKTNALLLQ
jgi:hypothetical protein